VDSFFHQFLDVLKVPFHPHFKLLLRVSDVDLVCQFIGNSVNDYRHSAIVPILTLAWSSTTSSAVAVPYFEIKQLDAFR
jgi:hypothetical protein